jgi:hypothetical protein
MGKESPVVRACIEYLRLRGAFVFRNQTGMIRLSDPKYGQRVIRQGVKGGADIVGVLPGGRFLSVECKKPLGPRGGTGGSVQTPEQAEFQREVEQRGGVYVLARGIDDLEPLFGST